jgi:ABC-type branched-subunit amino acid transport system substrate-binding protein
VVGASSNVFYLGLSASRQGETLGKTIAENEKIRQIVFVQDERRTDAAALIDAFQKAMGDARKESKGAAPIFVTVRFGKDPIWTEVTERVLIPPPQAIVFVGEVGDFNDWRRVAQKDYPIAEIEMVYAGSDGDQNLFNGNGSSVLFASAFHADPASDKINAFRATCKEKFQIEADVHAALAYDGMRILVDAMKKTSAQVISEKIHEALLKTKDFDGLNGSLSISADRQLLRPSFVLRWQNGASTLLKSYPAPKEAK